VELPSYRGATSNGALVLPERCVGKEKGFGFNHKIMIKVQELPLNIMVTTKLMVCESPGKRLVV